MVEKLKKKKKKWGDKYNENWIWVNPIKKMRWWKAYKQILKARIK